MTQAPKPLRDDTIALPDGRLVGFAEFGDPKGDVVFWLHGTPGARQQLPPDTHVEAARRGLRVIGIDRPGTGKSTPYLYDVLIEFAVDLAAVADALGIERFGLVGLSGGGPYVLACAHQLPSRVVAAAVLGGIGPTRGHDRAPGYTRLLPLAEPVLTILREPLAELLNLAVKPLGPVSSPAYDLYARFGPRTDRPLLRRADMKEMFLNDMVSAMKSGLRAPVYDVVLFSRPWGFSLRHIKVPVHFWQGDSDLIVPPSHGGHQAALVPGASLTTVAGEGHFAGFAQVEDVLDRIESAFAP